MPHQTAHALEKMPRSPVDLSVIIPFRDAAPHIRGQLEALANQVCDREWEVVAVDNGSSDDSREIVESFRDRLNLVILDVATKRGAGHARNVGARHASGERLIFIDADDAVAPGYLREMATGFDRHDFLTSNFDHSTLNPDWVRDAHGPLWRDPADPLGDHFGVMPSAGGSIGITRQIFEAVGGFPEDFRRMQDIAFSWEVQSRGVVLHLVPGAIYRVRFRGTLIDLFRQAFAGSSYAPLLYKRYGNLGMQRRTLLEVARSWARLGVGLLRARTKADAAALVIQLGRQLGRIRGSLRHRVFFP